jgi:hypothetical protein
VDVGLGKIGGIFGVVRSASHEWPNSYCGGPDDRAAHRAAALTFLLVTLLADDHSTVSDQTPRAAGTKNNDAAFDQQAPVTFHEHVVTNRKRPDADPSRGAFFDWGHSPCRNSTVLDVVSGPRR